MDDMDDRRPVWRRLRDQIAGDIARNKWLPGEPIPTESDLTAKYTISIGTVRKAIDALVHDGLVERVHGSGTFLKRPDFSRTFTRFAQVFGSAADPRIPESRILKRETLPGPLAVTEALALERDARVIRILRLRIHEGRPVMHEEIWLSEARFAPILSMPDEQPRLLYPIYEALCGEIVARALETITIETANDRNRELIGMQPGDGVVYIERLAVGYDDHRIEWRHSRSAAADFRYKVEIR